MSIFTTIGPENVFKSRKFVSFPHIPSENETEFVAKGSEDITLVDELGLAFVSSGVYYFGGR